MAQESAFPCRRGDREPRAVVERTAPRTYSSRRVRRLVVGWVCRDAPHQLAHAIGGVKDFSENHELGAADAFATLFDLMVVIFYLLVLTASGLVLVVGASLRLWRLRRAGRQPSLLVATLLAGGIALLMPAAWFFGEAPVQRWLGVY